LENIYCLLTVYYQSLSVKSISTMTFEEAVVISPASYAGYRMTTDNRPTRQTSMRWHGRIRPSIYFFRIYSKTQQSY